MMRIALIAALALAGCATPSLSVKVADQRLVAGPSPSVAVVADADAPVFFHYRRYWLFHDNSWYVHYRDLWVRIAEPPTSLLAIGEPDMYIHYCPTAQTALR